MSVFCFNGGRRIGEAYPLAMLEVEVRWRGGYGLYLYAAVRGRWG